MLGEMVTKMVMMLKVKLNISLLSLVNAEPFFVVERLKFLIVTNLYMGR